MTSTAKHLEDINRHMQTCDVQVAASDKREWFRIQGIDEMNTYRKCYNYKYKVFWGEKLIAGSINSTPGLYQI